MAPLAARCNTGGDRLVHSRKSLRNPAPEFCKKCPLILGAQCWCVVVNLCAKHRLRVGYATALPKRWILEQTSGNPAAVAAFRRPRSRSIRSCTYVSAAIQRRATVSASNSDAEEGVLLSADLLGLLQQNGVRIDDVLARGGAGELSRSSDPAVPSGARGDLTVHVGAVVAAKGSVIGEIPDLMSGSRSGAARL